MIASMFRAEPVGAPFPGVAHVREEAETIGRKRIDRTGSSKAVLGGVQVGEVSLPDVALVLALDSQCVAPGIKGLLATSACCILPLRLCWETQASPRAIRLGIVPGRVDDRVILAL